MLYYFVYIICSYFQIILFFESNVILPCQLGVCFFDSLPGQLILLIFSHKIIISQKIHYNMSNKEDNIERDLLGSLLDGKHSP